MEDKKEAQDGREATPPRRHDATSCSSAGPSATTGTPPSQGDQTTGLGDQRTAATPEDSGGGYAVSLLIHLWPPNGRKVQPK